MILQKGRVYRCQNPRCGAEVRVEKESIDGFSIPVCCCGAQMVRRYEPPSFERRDATPELTALPHREQDQ